MTWADRTPGTWMLTQFVEPGTNGSCLDLGEFPSYRAAVEAARSIAEISTLKGGFTTTFCRSHKRQGGEVDGFTRSISLERPTAYDPHIEIALPNGTAVWLGDVIEKIMTPRPPKPEWEAQGLSPERRVYLELEAMTERIAELYDWADGEGYPAIAHKLQEGRIAAAAEAARQYDTGELKWKAPNA